MKNKGNRLFSIPILGQLAKIVRDIMVLPRSNAMFQEQLEEYNLRLNETEKALHNYQAANSELIQVINEYQVTIASLQDTIATYNLFDECIKGENDWRENLNLQLSISPTLWGDRERLHISKLASVFTCFFNTNSGEITIDDYTFAGSGVSILAGSHDMYLEGLLRRDSEIKTGCDIVIGKGVWLGSGCTLLGPCVIGDNAVIAAGAVVTPGSNIPDNVLCAGVPAKVIKKIDINMDIHGTPVQAALIREDGILFVYGWTEKRLFKYGERQLWGHWMSGLDSTIYTNRKELHLLFHYEMEGKFKILIKTSFEQFEVVLEQSDQEIYVPLENTSEVLNEVHILCEYDMDNKFLVVPV